MIRIGALFSGIGGLELGLERALAQRGHAPQVAWQTEIDPRCRSVLARHWPAAVRHGDVREIGAHNVASIDLLCGGFPCQDVSVAGTGLGLSGERSGLWREFARLVRELRPRVVVVENVAALLARGLGDVLGDLAACGYDALWDCVPAAAVGAPHRRDRLFVVAWRVADAKGITGWEQHASAAGGASAAVALRCSADVADTDGEGEPQPRRGVRYERGRTGDSRPLLADADGERLEERDGLAVAEASEHAGPAGRGRGVARGAAQSRVGRGTDGVPVGLDGSFDRAVVRVRESFPRWPASPGEPPCAWEPPRELAGVAGRTARLSALGNAVSPVVAEVIGHVVADVFDALGTAPEVAA